MSEASPVVTFKPIAGPWKDGSIGRPIADVEVSIQTDAGELLPPGQTGKSVCAAATSCWATGSQPAATTETMRDGWLLTGDIGHRDADGYFYITDRKKDMLLVNGINVYPREIEEVLYQFPGVKEVAVIGEPDARRGGTASGVHCRARGRACGQGTSAGLRPRATGRLQSAPARRFYARPAAQRDRQSPENRTAQNCPQKRHGQPGMT